LADAGAGFCVLTAKATAASAISSTPAVSPIVILRFMFYLLG
jgi:hypothetical protein